MKCKLNILGKDRPIEVGTNIYLFTRSVPSVDSIYNIIYCVSYVNSKLKFPFKDRSVETRIYFICFSLSQYAVDTPDFNLFLSWNS